MILGSWKQSLFLPAFKEYHVTDLSSMCLRAFFYIHIYTEQSSVLHIKNSRAICELKYWLRHIYFVKSVFFIVLLLNFVLKYNNNLFTKARQIKETFLSVTFSSVHMVQLIVLLYNITCTTKRVSYWWTILTVSLVFKCRHHLKKKKKVHIYFCNSTKFTYTFAI